MDEPHSNRLIDIINWGRELFIGERVEHPRYTIEVLLEHLLGKKRAELYCDYDYRLTPAELELLRGYVKRRLERRPLWHIVGGVEFYGLPFRVTDRVLIPRPETEVLVETALREIDAMSLGRVAYVADIGTGSGNIAVALARHRSDVFVYASDTSSEALATAKANARANGVEGAIAFLEGDLCEPFCFGGAGRLDMIISNPPYVSAAEWKALPPEVSEREPRLALYGGEDGLELIGRLVAASPRCLASGGRLILEVGRGQARRVRGMIEKTGAFIRAEVHRDYSGIERAVLGVKNRSNGELK